MGWCVIAKQLSRGRPVQLRSGWPRHDVYDTLAVAWSAAVGYRASIACMSAEGDVDDAPSGISPRVQALAGTSANFGYLNALEPLLLLYGAGAEANCFTGPSETLIQARRFGEVLTVSLCRIAGIQVAGHNFSECVKMLAQTSVIDRHRRDLLRDVLSEPKTAGDEAASPNDIDELVALRAVRRCFELGAWFYRFRTGDRGQIPFVPPRLPEDADGDVRTELEAARRMLQETRVRFVDWERDRERVLAQARLQADDEIALAESAREAMAAHVDALSSERVRMQAEFDAAPAVARLSASQREGVLVEARKADLEPLSEVQVREHIDKMLRRAGWVVQDGRGNQNLYATRGVAVREVTTAAGRADYLLYVDRRPVGVIEAKREGADLVSALDQAGRYAGSPTAQQATRAPHVPLPYQYASDGHRILFRDTRDPEFRFREVFWFHQVETVARWLREADADREAPTYRARLRKRLPELEHTEVEEGRLRVAQYDAVSGFERALRRGNQRALIQMATGAGKTFAAVTACYRLLKYAKAERILFLVDRNNLGEQALAEFANYTTPDDGRKFTELYNVDQLTGVGMLRSSKVVVSTIQRLSKVLAGAKAVDPHDYSDLSEFERDEAANDDAGLPSPVDYSAGLPPESFDLIIIDEAHRSIYGEWRKVIEYFDAHLLGLTATPASQTYAFFGGESGLVSEYPYSQAIADGVAVDYVPFRIDTVRSAQGGVIPKREHVLIKDRRTRRKRYEELRDQFEYSGGQLGATVISKAQLRVVLTTFRDSIEVLFPGRAQVPVSMRSVPKTLIFARDDNHAEEVVEAVKDVFGRGDEFCKKITAKADRPELRLAEFRNAPALRIAITVDMIATGTDIRPIECVFFLRNVRSAQYFEQMLGRGSRVIDTTELRAVTPDVAEKTHFVLIDAVGVLDSYKREAPPIPDEKRGAQRLALRRLLEKTAGDGVNEDEAEELGLRLARLARDITDEDRQEIARLAGEPLESITRRILRAVDVDNIDRIRREATKSDVNPDRAVDDVLQQAASALASNTELRALLLNARRRQLITYDEYNPDRLISAGFVEDAPRLVAEFGQYVDEHRAELTAIQLSLWTRDGNASRQAYQQLKDLAAMLARPPRLWRLERLWRAYEQVGKAIATPGRHHSPADLIPLLRHELRIDEQIRPYRSVVDERFARFLVNQRQKGENFTSDELWWLERIADLTASAVRFDVAELDRVPFTQRGGVDGFLRTFGDDRAEALLDELDRDLSV